MASDNSWKTPNFRQSAVAKIEEAVQMSGMPTTKNSVEMENHVFQKAQSKEEYLGFVTRLILHIREMNTKKSANAPGTAGTNNQGMPDPIGALQTLARQGTGNNQMMGMGGPSSNHQDIIPQPPANTATNRISQIMASDDSWKTPNFRQAVAAKIEEAVQMSGMPTTKNSVEMENHVFQKAQSKEEYLGFVARLILHVREVPIQRNFNEE